MRATLLVLATSLLATAAPAQVIPEWETTPPVTGGWQCGGENLAAIGVSGHWYVGGREHAFVNQEYFPHWEPSGHFLARIDAQGQVVWSQLWNTQPAPPLDNALAMEIAADPTNDARIAFATRTGVVVLQRRSATDGSIVWSTPAPPGSGSVIPGSLAVLADGREIVALARDSGYGYVVCSADGVILQSSVWTTGLTAAPAFAAATDSATGRVAVAATAWSVNGMIAVHAADGSVEWSNSAVDMTVSALAFGPAGEIAAVGTDSHSHLRFRLYDAAGATIGEHAEPWVGVLAQGWGHVAFDPWGSIAVVGRVGNEASIAKFSAAGALEWHRTWAGVNAWQDIFTRVLASPTGEYFAMGTTSLTDSYPYPQQQFRLAVTAWRRDGTLAWEHVDPPTAGENERPAAIARTPLGSLVVAGRREHAYSTQFADFLPDDVHVLSLRPQTSAFCFGDSASTSACPCSNASAPGALAGCANSTGGGARLSDSGIASLANDSLSLTVSGLPASTTCIVFHSRSAGAAVFGDGVRCALGGWLVRLYSAQASAGVANVPPILGPSVSTRSAAAGDPLAAGSVRYLQAFYRNVAPFCTPAGFNASSGLILTWAP